MIQNQFSLISLHCIKNLRYNLLTSNDPKSIQTKFKSTLSTGNFLQPNNGQLQISEKNGVKWRGGERIQADNDGAGVESKERAVIKRTKGTMLLSTILLLDGKGEKKGGKRGGNESFEEKKTTGERKRGG